MKSKLEIDEHGTKRWKLPGGDYHREDGPAVEIGGINEYRAWYLNGKRHREDGLCVICYGNKHWFLNDIEYSKQNYKKQIRLIKLEEIL